MFGTNNIHGNESAIAEAYVNKIGGDAQLQQIFEVLLNDPPEELEELEEKLDNLQDLCDKLESEKEELEDKLSESQAEYQDLLNKWESIGGDALL